MGPLCIAPVPPHPPLHNLGEKPSGNVALQAEIWLHSCVIPWESPHKLPCFLFFDL